MDFLTFSFYAQKCLCVLKYLLLIHLTMKLLHHGICVISDLFDNDNSFPKYLLIYTNTAVNKSSCCSTYTQSFDLMKSLHLCLSDHVNVSLPLEMSCSLTPSPDVVSSMPQLSCPPETLLHLIKQHPRTVSLHGIYILKHYFFIYSNCTDSDFLPTYFKCVFEISLIYLNY